jgi:alpha-ribazole phosphatase/probable phosphoglycerate mutase
VQAAVTEISHRFPLETVLVIAHGLCLATLICKAQNIPLAEVYNYIPDNASPVQLTWSG